MVTEIIGMVIGSNMIENGLNDERKAENLERRGDSESIEYRYSGMMKKTSGTFIFVGSLLSFGAEIFRLTRSTE